MKCSDYILEKSSLFNRTACAFEQICKLKLHIFIHETESSFQLHYITGGDTP